MEVPPQNLKKGLALEEFEETDPSFCGGTKEGWQNWGGAHFCRAPPAGLIGSPRALTAPNDTSWGTQG